MPKSNLSWDLVESKLVVTVLATKSKITFDLVKIYPDFAKYTDVQQKLIAYGTKQKLADKVAKPTDEKLTPSEMVTELNALWKRLVEGTWRIEGESRSTKLKKAWDSADATERKVLIKLGLKPA